MLYEQEVTSLPSLMRRVRVLDQDAGVRMAGTFQGKKVLVFVTRFGGRYTMMTYTVGARTKAPGKRLATLEFDSVEGVGRALKGLAPRRLRAWVY